MCPSYRGIVHADQRWVEGEECRRPECDGTASLPLAASPKPYSATLEELQLGFLRPGAIDDWVSTNHHGIK